MDYPALCRQPFLVMMGACFSASQGLLWTLLTRLTVDALPDLSDVQVIIKLSAIPAGPQIVENGHLSTYHHHAVRAAQNRAWFSRIR